MYLVETERRTPSVRDSGGLFSNSKLATLLFSSPLIYMVTEWVFGPSDARSGAIRVPPGSRPPALSIYPVDWPTRYLAFPVSQPPLCISPSWPSSSAAAPAPGPSYRPSGRWSATCWSGPSRAIRKPSAGIGRWAPGRVIGSHEPLLPPQLGVCLVRVTDRHVLLAGVEAAAGGVTWDQRWSLRPLDTLQPGDGGLGGPGQPAGRVDLGALVR